MHSASNLFGEMWKRARSLLTAPSSTPVIISAEQELVAEAGPMMDELRENLQTAEGRYIRQLYVVPARDRMVLSSEPGFTFYETVYPMIGVHLNKLEQLGLVSQLSSTEDQVRVYRISQRLVSLVMSR